MKIDKHTIITKNAFTGEPMLKIPLEGKQAVIEQIEKARVASKKWRGTPVAARVAYLGDALHYFVENRILIAEEITQHIGRPIEQAKLEIDGLMERAFYLLSIAEETLEPEVIHKDAIIHQEITHEPIGLIFMISAWNYPLLVTINGMLSALLGGNAVLLKHSPITPSIGIHFAQTFGKIPGFEGLVAHCMMRHQTAEEIIEESLVDHVLFTGSVASGKKVYQQAAKALIGCQLELGGKDAAYIAPDTDIAKAAAIVVEGATYNCGQSCCGIERVYVHNSILQKFLEHCQQAMSKIVIGDPMQKGTTLGPQARPENITTIQRQLRNATEQGATILYGGSIAQIRKASFVEPTLLTNVNHKMEIMREENFAPILPVMTVSNEDEAIDLINDSQYGLTASIFTNDEALAQKFYEGVEVGTVYQNKCDTLDPALPWGGFKQSGIGSTLSNYGLLQLTQRKARNFKVKD